MDYDNANVWEAILFLILIASLPIVIGYTIYDAYTAKYECIEKRIVSVGGCNRDGWCGVMLDDNTKDSAHLPVVGETHKQCYRIK